MDAARRLLTLIVLLLSGAALMYVIQAGSGLAFMPSDKISPSDFISIILSALGVTLAALALFLGGLAIIGWSAFEDRVKQNSEEFLERRFSATDPRYVELIEELKEDVRRELEISRRQQPQIENESPFDEDAA